MIAAANPQTLNALKSARQLVQFVSPWTDMAPPSSTRAITSHVGAALADCVLQAGLSYSNVVSIRVRRIIELFPEASTVSGIIDVLSEHGPGYFLDWTHRSKIVRFTGLICHLHEEGIESYANLRGWLEMDRARNSLLTLEGIGPKTVDYLSTLIGLDCVAIDRHVRRLARLAGIEQTDYSELKLVISFAADLMDVPRRHFDWWLWQLASQKGTDNLDPTNHVAFYPVEAESDGDRHGSSSNGN